MTRKGLRRRKTNQPTNQLTNESLSFFLSFFLFFFLSFLNFVEEDNKYEEYIIITFFFGGEIC